MKSSKFNLAPLAAIWGHQHENFHCVTFINNGFSLLFLQLCLKNNNLDNNKNQGGDNIAIES